LFSLPSGCKINYGHSRYEPKQCSGSFGPIFAWPSENRESGASDHEKTRKAPGALPRRFPPPPLGVLNILWSLKIQALACVAKDATSMFGRAKTGGLGKVNTKKHSNNEKKKTGITRPRPDGWVKDGHYQTRSDGGVISRKKKTVITRPLPDGGVINEIQVDCS